VTNEKGEAKDDSLIHLDNDIAPALMIHAYSHPTLGLVFGFPEANCGLVLRTLNIVIFESSLMLHGGVRTIFGGESKTIAGDETICTPMRWYIVFFTSNKLLAAPPSGFPLPPGLLAFGQNGQKSGVQNKSSKSERRRRAEFMTGGEE